jgi:hypothetical protein
MEKKKKKVPTDINKIAAYICDVTTKEINAPDVIKCKPEKNPAAVALGRLGGLKGGKARKDSLTPERRKEIAQKAAKTRWTNKAT